MSSEGSEAPAKILGTHYWIPDGEGPPRALVRYTDARGGEFINCVTKAWQPTDRPRRWLLLGVMQWDEINADEAAEVLRQITAP